MAGLLAVRAVPQGLLPERFSVYTTSAFHYLAVRDGDWPAGFFCVSGPRQESRGSYLKPPAIEAGGGWVRRGGASSRASGPIWVAAVGGL